MGGLVYKYRSGNKATFDRDLDSLEENCFFAPNFKSLNDPCETLVFSGQQFAVEIDNLIDIRNRIGIYSLSRTYKDELLWAHYADSHFGFCIEYDLDILIDTYEAEKIYSFPVVYSDKPPKIDITEIAESNGDNISVLQKIAGHKSNRWENEKEHRLIIDRFGEQAYNFNAVKSIYFGLRMKDENKDAIMNRLQGRGINYYQMFQKEKSYEFDAKPIDDINGSELTYLQEIPSTVTNSTSVKYRINKKNYDWVNGKAEIEIILESKVNKASLQWLAELIRKHIFKQAERIFMFYYIEGEEDNEICWASSHFLFGEITVSINSFVDNKK